MNNKSRCSRKNRAIETKKRLYATADALFMQHGLDNVSVDMIVEKAGLSKGTFYVHFLSKDDLLASLISDYIEAVDMDYQAFIDAFPHDMPSTDILLRLAEKIMDVILNQIGQERMKTLYRTQLTNIASSGNAASYQRLLYKMMTDVLERGMQKGDFAAVLVPDELAKHLVLAMRGLVYEWCIRYPDFDLQEQTRAHFNILLRGICQQS